MMRSHAKRDAHFRPGFKISQGPKTKPRVKKVSIGWHARPMAKGKGPLGISEMLYRTGLKTPKALAKACRAGQFPKWRYDRLTGRVLWHRLEFEALMYWQRARRARAHGKARSRPGQARKASR